MDRVTALRNAAGIARNQELVGDLGSGETALPEIDPLFRNDDTSGRRKWTAEDAHDPTQREIMNQRFRNILLNNDDIRPSMEEVDYGEGFPKSGIGGLGRDLTTGNWADAHQAAQNAYNAQKLGGGIATDRNSLQGQAGPVGYTGRLETTRTPQMPNIMMQRNSLQGQAGPVGYTSREQMLRNAQNMARYR